MKFDKKEIALSVTGILASMVIAYIIYRKESEQNAANAAASEEAASEASYSQAQQAVSLPSISVPSLSTASGSSGDIATATANGATPSSDATLEAIVAGLQGNNSNKGILGGGTGNPQFSAQQENPQTIGLIAALPIPTSIGIPDVVVPTVENFSSNAPSPVASPIVYNPGVAGNLTPTSGGGGGEIIGQNGYNTNTRQSQVA